VGLIEDDDRPILVAEFIHVPCKGIYRDKSYKESRQGCGLGNCEHANQYPNDRNEIVEEDLPIPQSGMSQTQSSPTVATMSIYQIGMVQMLVTTYCL
jgi:hypothetical protein